MRLIIQVPGLALFNARRIWRRFRMYMLLPLFRAHGHNVRFDPDGTYSFENIILGSDVSLGLRPTLLAARSIIRIGNKVMFGPHVTLIGGNHNTSVVGRAMFDVQEKRPEDDLGVTIQDDVWVGTRAVILRGVTVGRGAIIAAGSVVSKDVPPYSIVAGCPARVLKFRWTVETVLEHERSAYCAESRIPEAELRIGRRGLDRTQCQ